MLVTTSRQFDDAIAKLSKSQDVVVDTETSGLAMFSKEGPARMCGIAIGDAAVAGHDYYFSFRHGEGPNLKIELLDYLRQYLEHKTWLGHNISFDSKILHCDGFSLPSQCQDSMIAAHLVNENEPSFALKKLAVEHLGKDAAQEDSALQAELKKRKLSKGDISKLSAELVAPYALADIDLTRRLHANRFFELDRWRLLDLYKEVMAFQLALIRTEIRGIMLDQDEVNRQLETIGPKITDYMAELRKLSGRDINPNSPAQLKNWLNMPSTAHQALVEELEKNPREDIQTLLDYRSLSKAEGTYFRPFLEMVDTSSRLHTSYKVHGTVTGRLSSSEPNLQQLSRDSDKRLYSVKKCFRAAEGHFLLECDYSAIEPRIAAHYSNDPTMIDAFVQGKDFHTSVAKSMFKKADINKGERQNAKTLGLGVLYGMGANKAAKNLKLRHARINGLYEWCDARVWAFSDQGELVECACSEVSPEFCTYAGRSYIRKFYEGLPELEPFVKAVRSTAARNGYIRNPFSGRCRRFEDNGSAHKSFNSLIQSTAAEILRRAFTKLDGMFENMSDLAPKIVLTVHDSIVFEIPFSDMARDYCWVIKETMEETTKLRVPVVVDMKMGYNLGNMVEVKF